VANSPPRVLITGSSGFIGGRLFERFAADGWQAVGLGRRPTVQPGYVSHDLARPLPENLGPFDVVIHAAARSSPYGRRQEFHRQNVLATEHVLDHCLRHGKPRLVFLSSSSVYYRPEHQLGITEDTPLPERAVNEYAATKQRAEELVKAYPGGWVILRPRAVFGPGDTVLLPRILAAARAGKLPLLKSGGPPAVGDLIYIDNLVDCVVTAATDPAVGGCINVTNNEPVVLDEFMLDLFRRLGIPAPKKRVSAGLAMLGAGVIDRLYSWFRPDHEPPITRFGVHVFAYSKTFDVTRMLEVLGPPRVKLAEALDRTVAWEQEARSSATSSPS
jgi:nucleoside-diphosphate-sugar epimerase